MTNNKVVNNAAAIAPSADLCTLYCVLTLILLSKGPVCRTESASIGAEEVVYVDVRHGELSTAACQSNASCRLADGFSRHPISRRFSGRRVHRIVF